MDSSNDPEHVCPKQAALSGHDKNILDRIFNPNLPYVEDDDTPEPQAEEEELDEIGREAKRIELEGVQAAEQGKIQEAMDFFNKAIEMDPERASGYNNRAQALRILRDEQGALDDLNKTIQLSNGQGLAARQAYTQRGLIRKLEGQTELAVEDFKKAANLGCVFAKDQVIAMNPYAALCNTMMKEMITKVKAGEA